MKENNQIARKIHLKERFIKMPSEILWYVFPSLAPKIKSTVL